MSFHKAFASTFWSTFCQACSMFSVNISSGILSLWLLHSLVQKLLIQTGCHKETCQGLWINAVCYLGSYWHFLQDLRLFCLSLCLPAPSSHSSFILTYFTHTVYLLSYINPTPFLHQYSNVHILMPPTAMNGKVIFCFCLNPVLWKGICPFLDFLSFAYLSQWNESDHQTF